MGRPLNKKYFGNRNAGSASTAADNGLGGNVVASATVDTAGSYAGGSQPTITFSAPDKAAFGAVTATGTTVMEGLSAVATAGGTGYVIGDLLTVTYGGQTLVAVVASLGASDAVATVNFTGTGADRGTFTATTTGAKTTTTNSVAGAGATLTITYRVKAITITESGSGYTDAADAAITFSAGTGAATAVLGTAAVVGNNENAISMVAFLTGGSAGAVDIIKQVSARRYKVTDGTRTGIVALTATEADAAGEGSIQAVDSVGGTYFVTKLTAHKATLTRGTGTAFATGEAVKWTLGSAVLGDSVQIANA